jgi:hypothetical protein
MPTNFVLAAQMLPRKPAMDSERRKGDMPIPDSLEGTLNEAQLIALPALERFGWELRFVRRPLFQEAVPVVCNAEGTMVGVLEEDGRLNLQLAVQIRGSMASEDMSVARVRTSDK